MDADRRMKPGWIGEINTERNGVGHSEFIPFPAPGFAEPPTVHICLSDFAVTTGEIRVFTSDGRYKQRDAANVGAQAVDVKTNGFTLNVAWGACLSTCGASEMMITIRALKLTGLR